MTREIETADLYNRLLVTPYFTENPDVFEVIVLGFDITGEYVYLYDINSDYYSDELIWIEVSELIVLDTLIPPQKTEQNVDSDNKDHVTLPTWIDDKTGFVISANDITNNVNTNFTIRGQSLDDTVTNFNITLHVENESNYIELSEQNFNNKIYFNFDEWESISNLINQYYHKWKNLKII